MDIQKIINELEHSNYVDCFIDLVLELKSTNYDTTINKKLQSFIFYKSEIIKKSISENKEE